jgi:hypothetical protein
VEIEGAPNIENKSRRDNKNRRIWRHADKQMLKRAWSRNGKQRQIGHKRWRRDERKGFKKQGVHLKTLVKS